MKNIIKSSAMLMIVAAVVVGATGAFFSSQTASTGNVFTAGNIDLKVNHTAASYNGESCTENCVVTGGNLVQNGSFEEPAISGSWQLVSVLPGWTIEAGDQVEIQRTVFVSSAGDQHVELDGDGTNPATTISQTITTVPGTRYRLTFDHSPRPQAQAADSAIRLEVAVVSPGSTVFTDVINTGTGSINWTTYTYEFIAVNTTTTIRFAYQGVVNTFGGLLDNVVVQALDCTFGGYTTEGGQCQLWTPTNLTTEKFFNFEDVKPQDNGTNLISMVVESNPSYLCLNVANKENNENTYTAPEIATGDTTGGALQGELGQFLQVVGWKSDNLGNKIGNPLFGPTAVNNLGAITYTDSTTPDGPVTPGVTQYVQLEWCFGDMIVSGTNVTCNGSVPNINQAQTDAFLADLQFFAIQSRNNGDFTCANAFSSVEQPPVTGQTVTVGEIDLNTTLNDFETRPLAWFFFDDVVNNLMTIDQYASLGANSITNSAPAGATGGAAFMRLHDATARYNIATNQFGGTPLSAITSLSYRIYDGTTSPETPYLHFNVSFDGVPSWQNRLVMVPTATGNLGATSLAWTSVDAINSGNAVWCWSGMPPCGGTATQWPAQTGVSFADPTAPYQTWNDIVAAYPGAIMNSGPYSFLGIRVGHPGPANAEGYVDWVEMNGTTYNFAN